MTNAELAGVEDWLRDAVRDYRWGKPALLLDDGDRLSLPEDARLASKVIEMSLIERIRRKAEGVPGILVREGHLPSPHGNLTLMGRAVGGRRIAVHVRVVQRRSLIRRTLPVATSRTTSRRANLGVLALFDYVDGEAENLEVLVVAPDQQERFP